MANQSRRRSLALVVAAVGGTLLFFLRSTGAEYPSQQKSAQDREPPARRYVGFEQCSGCHEEPRGAYRKLINSCQLTEYGTWLNKDPHSKASQILTSDRSKRMGELLGFDVAKDVRCLVCHATSKKGNQAQTVDDFLVTEGVTCEACHGPAGAWLQDHADQKYWRPLHSKDELPPEYLNVRELKVRVSLCISCHVGNAKEGKVVTHDMYAAGHPPMPVIEFASFSEKYYQRHWDRLDKKPEEVRKVFAKYESGGVEMLRLALVGGLEAFQQSVEVLAQAAGANTGDNKKTPQWPDFTFFDCQACHHDLQNGHPSWRQQRYLERQGAGGIGRPQLRTWPTILVRMGLEHLGEPASELEAVMAPMQKAMVRQPFGEPDELSKAAENAARWCEEKIKVLEADKGRYSKESARAFLQKLASLASKETLDYDSARHASWAFTVVYEAAPLDGAADKAVRDVLVKLDRGLKLSLPGDKKIDILGQLPEALEKINNYQPADFRKGMQELSKLLGGKE